MAHRGPAAKSVKHGRTPNADWTDVVDTPYAGPSPDLPKLPRRARWHEMVEHWWAQVREMPHCCLWRPVDWTFALETAHMKNSYWKMTEDPEARGLTTMAVEIRRREDQMGTTQEALRKLRIRYVTDPTAVDDEDEAEPEIRVTDVAEAGSSGGTVTSLSSRRANLTRPA